MLEEVLRYLWGTMIYKWPVKEPFGGTFEIKEGSIELPFLIEGQYFRIVGSVFNDGVYQYPVYTLTDEVFNGAVWVLALDPALLSLVSDIEKWQEENKKAIESPYQSESFGGYSYSMKDGENKVSWKSVFGDRLNRWRKI